MAFHPTGSVSFCRNCERFLSPPQSWMQANPESSELLSICLKKLKGLNKVRLTDAHFIWTEPHSKRLRVSLTIQKEVQTLILFLSFGPSGLNLRSTGPQKHDIGTNLRNRVPRATWAVSRLCKACGQKHLEGACASSTKGCS